MSQAGVLNRGVFPPGSVVQTIEGNTGGPVGPNGANNIFVVGDGTTIEVAGNPGTNTLTISTSDAVAIQYTTDSGVAVPVAGNLNVFGGTAGRDINTSGAGDSINIDLNNTITLGDLAVVGTGADSLTLVTGDLSVDAGNINLPTTSAAGADGVINVNAGRFIHSFGGTNTFVGAGSGNFTLTGFSSVGIGANSLQAVTSGAFNTAMGFLSGGSISSGASNVAIGSGALSSLTTTGSNVAVGPSALNSLVSGQNNVAVGYFAGSAYTTAEENNITIGNVGIVGENDTIRIGSAGTQAQTFIYGIDQVDLGAVVNVVTEDNDQLGTANITGTGGITINASSNQIQIDGSGVSAGTITGNIGLAQPQTAGNWDIVTANSTVLFSGALSTLTLDFNPSNLLLGSSGISITTAARNVAAGNLSGDSLVDGTDNTLIGDGAGRSLTDEVGVVAIGAQAILNAVTGSHYNIGIGYQALTALTDNAPQNIAVGAFALQQLDTGASNVAIGTSAGANYTTTESTNICIQNQGVIADNGAIRIGTSGNHTSCFIAGIVGASITPTQIAGIDGATEQIAGVTLVAGTNMAITAGVGTYTFDATPSSYAYTNVNSTPYVVLTTDLYLSVDSSGGAITVQLPNAATSGKVYIVKDRTGSAATNNITVTTVGGAVNIDGATTFVMNTAYESINVIGNGSTYEIF